MSEIRHRLEVHRNDALVLLEEVTRTARLHEGIRLAGALGHMAQAQVLLAEELFSLSDAAEGEPQFTAERSTQSNDDTPVDGVRLKG